MMKLRAAHSLQKLITIVFSSSPRVSENYDEKKLDNSGLIFQRRFVAPVRLARVGDFKVGDSGQYAI